MSQNELPKKKNKPKKKVIPRDRYSESFQKNLGDNISKSRRDNIGDGDFDTLS